MINYHFLYLLLKPSIDYTKAYLWLKEGFILQSQEKNPIIFIPGLMGSMGDDIITGTGDWSFGVAKWLYEPFLNNLEEMGYSLKENLYVCYYDWRKDHKTIVKKYLLPLIDKVKERHLNHKIDFICHSMGGTVARCYIQDFNNPIDIDKLIMIGTPNHGAIAAYYFWSTGYLLSKEKGNNLIDLIIRGYMWILLGLMDVSFGLDNLKELHQTFPSVEELMPSRGYGDFLCYDNGNKDGNWGMIPIDYMKYQNHFLNKLNYSEGLLLSRTNKVYNIIGYNYSTPEYLMIDKEKWFQYDEEDILDIVDTLEGDGTVAVRSARMDNLKDYFIEANHKEMLQGSLDYIKEIYGVKTVEPKMKRSLEEGDTLHILFKGQPNFILYRDDRVVIFELYEGEINTEHPYIYEKYPKDHGWIIVKDISKGNYSIHVKNQKPEAVHMVIMAENLLEGEEEKIITYQKSRIYKFEIN